MGRNDPRTKKGKISRKSNGVSRPKQAKLRKIRAEREKKAN